MSTRKQRGYTILEMMIVLAISAAMFVTAVIALGGRQQEVQFSQAVRDFESRLQDNINDVSSGFFNNEGNVNCSVANVVSPTSEPSVSSGASDGQGTSDDCVFIGKVLHFYPEDPDTSDDVRTDASTIFVYNVVGRRENSGNLSVSSLDQALPTAIGPSSLVDPLNEEITILRLDWGLRVTNIQASDGVEYGALGFFTSFSNTLSDPVGDTTISNNQKVRYGAIPDSSLKKDGPPAEAGQNPFEMVNIINSLTDTSPSLTGRSRQIDLSGSRSITICLQNAEQDRRAAIILGADGQTNTRMEFDFYDEAVCGT